MSILNSNYIDKAAVLSLRAFLGPLCVSDFSFCAMNVSGYKFGNKVATLGNNTKCSTSRHKIKRIQQ